MRVGRTSERVREVLNCLSRGVNCRTISGRLRIRRRPFVSASANGYLEFDRNTSGKHLSILLSCHRESSIHTRCIGPERFALVLFEFGSSLTSFRVSLRTRGYAFLAAKLNAG